MIGFDEKIEDKLISGKIVYHHASNIFRLTYFLILCNQILWINQISKDNYIKGEYKVNKNKPCKLISLAPGSLFCRAVYIHFSFLLRSITILMDGIEKEAVAYG